MTESDDRTNEMTLYVEAINTTPATIATEHHTTTIDVELSREDAEALAILFQTEDKTRTHFRIRLTGRLVIS